MSIFETKFPGSLIDHEELCELVNSLAAKMGEKADVEQLTIVGTDDTEFSNLLDSLAEGLKRKLLAAGELKDGFVVCSWKGERWVVMDGKMIKEPQA